MKKRFYMIFFIFFGCSLFTQAEEHVDKKDTIVVHGMTLYGTIINLGPKRLSFQLLYSKGVNHIPYKEIESLSTEHHYHISFQQREIEGYLIGIEESRYLKVMEGELLRTIEIADIDNFVISVEDDNSLKNRIKNRLPYLKGDVSVGLTVEKGSSRKNKTDIELNLQHKKTQHELTFYLDYAFEKTKTENTEEVLNKDELLSVLHYKNYQEEDGFYFASIAHDYDRPRVIKSRYIPAVGYGHKFKFNKSQWLEPSLGVSYVTTKYQDNLFPDKNFAAASLQLSGKYQLDEVWLLNTLIVDGSLVYYPSFENLNRDWVLRSKLNFTVPLFNFLSIKLALELTNDSNPSPDVGNNKATSKLLFGVNF